MTEQERKEYQSRVLKIREKMLKEQAEMPEEERRRNREMKEMINAYGKKYPEGIPFQMPFSYEDIKEALEKDKPFHEQEKFKGYYEELPEGCID